MGWKAYRRVSALGISFFWREREVFFRFQNLYLKKTYCTFAEISIDIKYMEAKMNKISYRVSGFQDNARRMAFCM